jgi:hypothetical protein
LTGSIHFLSNIHQGLKHTESEVRDFIQGADLSLQLSLGKSFEVVVSICTLTQLIDMVVSALGDNHPYLFDFILKIRNHHLNQMVGLTSQQGWGLLITDIVSSDSCAEMLDSSDEDFPDLVNQLIANRNFFHGVNPYMLHSALSSNQLIYDAQILRPWRWNFGSRIYAVCAIEAQRKDSPTIAVTSAK